MKKLVKFFMSRLFWFGLGILIQFGVMLYISFAVTGNDIAYYCIMAITFCTAIFVITRDENPAYKIPWLLLLGCFPLLGITLYIIFGNKKFGKRASRRIEKYYEFQDKATLYDKTILDKVVNEDNRFARQAEYIYNVSRYGTFQNTEAKYFSNGASFLDSLLLDLEGAEKSIFIEYFIIDRGYMWSKILSILKKKAAEGVDIRILYDDMGSINTLPKNYYKELRSYGFSAYALNPVRVHLNPRLNYRDHRKIFCIDGNICYTGGLNLADEYMNKIIRFGYWKDNAVRLKGDAVWSFTVMFLTMWRSVCGEELSLDHFRPTVKVEGDGYILPFADNPFDGVTLARNAYLQVINNARRYVWIVTPYLILDNEMITALEIAAASGVDVRIITPFYADKKSVHEVSRASYEKLLNSGVRIFEYIPGFIHSKTLVSDDLVAFVGTANLDYRSFYLHFELSTMFLSSSIVNEVKRDTESAMAASKEQSLKEVSSISFPHRMLRIFFSLFAPAL